MRTKLKWALALVLLFAGVAEAATYNLPGSLKSSWGCSINGSTVTCNNFNLNHNDKVTVTGNITLKINGSASVQNAKINVDGGASKLTINITDNFTSNTGVHIEANITTAEKFTLGDEGTLLGSLNAKSATLKGKSTVTGNINVEEKLETTGSNATINGNIQSEKLETGSFTTINGNINSTEEVKVASDNIISGNIITEKFKSGSNTSVTGNIISSGDVEVGPSNTIIGSIQGDSIDIKSSGTKITGDLNATDDIEIGSGSMINGYIAGEGISVGSGSVITGTISADKLEVKPNGSIVNGDIYVVEDIELGSGSTVTGNVFAENIELKSSNVIIDGNVSVTGEVTIGSSGLITGDVTAYHIKNASGNSDNTVLGDMYCSSNSGFINRTCLTSSIPTGSSGLASCDATFVGMLGNGIIGGTDSNPQFTHKNDSTINGNPITGANGNSPTPNGVVSGVTTNFPALDPVQFPGNSNFNGSQQTDKLAIAPGAYEYIKTSNNGITSTSGGGVYFIGSLDLKKDTAITLGSGDYFIKTVHLQQNTQIIVAPGATVRIYIKDRFDTNFKAKINQNGSAGALAIFLYENAWFDLGDNNIFNGLLYSPHASADIKIKKNSEIYGAIISLGKVDFHKEITVTSNATTQQEIADSLGCGSQPNHGELSSCSDFNALSNYGIVGNSGFNYGLGSSINNINIYGSNGNSPTPNGNVSTVPVPNPFPSFAPPSFPYAQLGTSTITGATNIPPGSYGLIQTSWWSNSFTSTSGGGTYYINRLNIRGINSGIRLGAGDYFIDTIDMDMDSYINIEPGAKVRIFIGSTLDGSNRNFINANGNVENLSVFLYDNASFNFGYELLSIGNSVFKGLIYSPFANTTINIGKVNNTLIGWSQYIEGAILSAGNVNLGNRSKVTYTPQTQQAILDAAGCSALPPDPVLDHYRIVLHEQELVSCYAAPVTIKACENASCSSPFVGAVTGEVNSTAANSKWSGTSASLAGVSFTGGEATVGLSLVEGGHTAISLSNQTPAATNITQCVDSTGAPIACNLMFKTAGLLVSAPSHFAGDDFDVSIRAVETNPETGACEARVEGSKTVNLGVECVNPSSCMASQVFNANGTSVDLYNQGSSVPSTSVSLIFNAAGEATFNANYTDVGLLKFNASLDIAADASDPNVPEPATTLTGTGGVVVRPYTLIAQGLNDDLSPWTATAATGDGFKAAGENFFLAIQSLNAQGNPTPNFGNEIAAAEGSVAFHSIQFPTIAHDPSMASHLTFGQTFVPLPNVEGALVNQGVVWNEAGTVNLTAALTGNSYLGAGDAFERPARPVGRFYPHHFILKSSEVRNSCSVGDFSYSVGDFSYMADPNIGINFEIHAVNKTDDLLTNYGNGDSSTTGHYVGSAVAGLNQTVYPLLGRLNSVFNAAWDKGILIEDLTTVAFARPASTTPDGPFDNLDVYIEMSGAEDGRGFVSSNNEKLQGSLSLKYGRMVLESVSGPEDQNLNVVLNTEFWNGTSFVINSSDRCTDFDPAELAIIPGTNPNSIESAPGLIAGVVHSGSVTPGELYWQEPTGGTLPGQFNFEYNAPEWLRFDWGRVGDLNGTNQNPQATAGFGLYRGNDKIIFSLERNF